MSDNSGVKCKCKLCNEFHCYENGKCKGCKSSDAIEYTWVVKNKDKQPNCKLTLDSGAVAELQNIWDSFILLRGLSPYSDYKSVNKQYMIQYSPGDWCVERGLDIKVQYSSFDSPTFFERLNHASLWTNQSFIIRTVVVFEAFSQVFKNGWSSVMLPAQPGMRELHHARRMRNKIAHGDELNSEQLISEAYSLFGEHAVIAGSCNLDIALILEPLWVRLLLYAASLEINYYLPQNPGVVVAVNGSNIKVCNFSGQFELQRNNTAQKIGNIVSL